MAGFPPLVKGAAPRGGWRPTVAHRPQRGRGAYWRPWEKRRWQAQVHDALVEVSYFWEKGSGRDNSPTKGGEQNSGAPAPGAGASLTAG